MAGSYRVFQDGCHRLHTVVHCGLCTCGQIVQTNIFIATGNPPGGTMCQVNLRVHNLNFNIKLH